MDTMKVGRHTVILLVLNADFLKEYIARLNSGQIDGTPIFKTRSCSSPNILPTCEGAHTIFYCSVSYLIPCPVIAAG